MRRAARVDGNQPLLVERLRGIPGLTVQHLHTVGAGCPDLLVGYMGANYLLEVKDGEQPPSRRKLTADERKWHTRWCGQVAVVETFEEALIALGISTEPAPF